MVRLKYRDKTAAAQSLPARRASLLPVVLCCAVLSLLRPDPVLAEAEPPLPTDPDEALVERFYRTGDLYRTESEILRLLHARRTPKGARPAPEAAERAAALELTRAKLYHRTGRHKEADLMLYSLLDRYRSTEAASRAARLLAFSQVHQGQLDEAARWWDASDGQPGAAQALAPLRDEPPGLADPEAARSWSTWLPGSGYFEAEQPGKAWRAMGLNLVLIGATVVFAQADRPGAALAFLLLEALVYQGGRNGAAEDAEAHNRRLRGLQRSAWLAEAGEGGLLRVGIEHRF